MAPVHRNVISRFDVTIDGKPWAVELEDLDDGRTRVGIDGRDRFVEARALGAGAWSLLDRAGPVVTSPAGAARLLRVSGPLDKLAIEVSHPDGEPRMLVAAVAPARSADVAGAGAGGGAGGPAARVEATAPMTLRAPIPGKIVKLAVAVGDKVAAGQCLLVLEAMKMENEIRSPRDAEVKALHTVEGASVDAGQELVSLL